MAVSNRPSILHVDDDPAILALVAKKLRILGYEVISLQDPNLAIEKINQDGCRLVLCDIDMPGINGLDLLRRIKDTDGGIQVIMLTGVVSISTLLKSIQYGAEACVFKPIDEFDALVGHIQRACEKIDHWWTALRDLKTLKNEYTSAMV